MCIDPQPERATSGEQLAAFMTGVTPSARSDGWSGEKQRRFLEAVADGATVTDACAVARLSVAAAYAFRRRPAGQGFALGWSAANLIARDRVADRLFARAEEGQEATTTAADGSTRTRNYYDNGLALRLLDRLDRQAEAGERSAAGQAARLIAADFEAYLATIEADAGPARAGLFLSARAGAGDLEPLAALARADRMLRGGAGLASEVEVADLDPAARATWTGEQWARAEAAGLIQLAPAAAPEAPPEPAIGPQLPQLDDEPEGPVWWSDDFGEWRTSFPPPPELAGKEEDRYGDERYSRSLTPEEWVLCDGMEDLEHEAATADQRAAETQERDRVFEDWRRKLTEAGYESLLGDKPDYAPPPAPECRRCAKVGSSASAGNTAPPDGTVLH